MKTKSLFVFAAVSLWGLTSCNDENLPQPEETKQEVCFQVGVKSLLTRASHTNASTFNDFGISITSASGNQNYNWNNVKISALGEGSSRTWKPSQSMYWKYGQQTLNVLAYTPFNADVTEDLAQYTNFPVSVAVQQGPTEYASDFLVYHASGLNPVDSDGKFNALDINFQHAMSQVKVNLTFLGYTDEAIDAVKQITLNGTTLNGTCDFTKTSALVSPLAQSASPITINMSEKKDQTVTFPAILIPQTVKSGQLTISFNIDGWDYIWTSPETYTFAENTSYTLNITANDQKTTAATIQSTAWNTNR